MSNLREAESVEVDEADEAGVDGGPLTLVAPPSVAGERLDKALALLLPEARRLGLPYVELTADPDNLPSQRVITNNGGVLVRRFRKEPAYGDVEALLFRIAL